VFCSIFFFVEVWSIDS